MFWGFTKLLWKIHIMLDLLQRIKTSWKNVGLGSRYPQEAFHYQGTSPARNQNRNLRDSSRSSINCVNQTSRQIFFTVNLISTNYLVRTISSNSYHVLASASRCKRAQNTRRIVRFTRGYNSPRNTEDREMVIHESIYTHSLVTSSL